MLADLGIAGADRVESPRTCMPLTATDSAVIQSIPHQRSFAVMTQKFTGENGRVARLHCVQVDARMQPVPGSEFELPAELVLLALGFVHSVHEGLVKALGLALDVRGNVRASTDDYRSSLAKVFAAGDMRRGQSLVVWAIREGRQCARSVDEFLMGVSSLPR